MEGFSKHFNACNPHVFQHEDTAFILAYSVIMLNTDAHSPNVRKRMQLPEWFKNNSGIDNGKDLPAAMLEGIYFRITSNEIKLHGEQL